MSELLRELTRLQREANELWKRQTPKERGEQARRELAYIALSEEDHWLHEWAVEYLENKSHGQ